MGFIASFLSFDHVRAQKVVHNLDLAEPPTAQLTQLLNFHVDLADRLHGLKLAGGPAHLNWLLDSLSATISSHSSLRSALSTSSAAQGLTHELLQAPQTLPLQQHAADEIVSILDVCIVLKQVAEGLGHHAGRVDHALQSLEEALQVLPFSSFSSSISASSSSSSSLAHLSRRLSGSRLLRGTRRLAACLQSQTVVASELNKALKEASSSLISATSELRRVATPKGATEPAAALLSQAMHGAALTTLLVLATALSSLAPKCKRSGRIIARACKLKPGLSEKASPWAAPLTQLQQGLIQAEKSHAGALFQELEEMDAAATRLLLDINESLEGAVADQDEQMSAMRAEVKRMRKSVQALHGGMKRFGGDMGQLFQALLALRVALLEPPSNTQ